MGLELIDIAYIEISYTGGNKELSTAQKLSVEDAGDIATPVKTMNRRRRAIGYQDGIPEFTWSLDIKELAGEPEVDWGKLKRDREEFLLTYEEAQGGKRHRLEDCRVKSVKREYSESGEATITVEGVALDHRPE